MSTISTEKAKDLRNAFECWQQDYDPVEDKEQYEMFGLGIVAIDELLALRKEREQAAPVTVPNELPEFAPADVLKKYFNWTDDGDAEVFSMGWNACRAAMLQSGNDEIGSWGNHKNTPADKPKSQMSQKAEQLLRDTTALAATLSAETDTTSQQFESLAFKSVVPEGWKLVPVELTKEMLKQIHPFAEATCLDCGNQVVAHCADNVTASWNDMLAVAPEPCK